MAPLNLTGLVAASFTPMKSDGSVDLERIPALVEHLHAQGISGLYLNGSTGEGMLLTDDERKAVAEAYLKANAGRMKTFVQVGHASWKSAADLAAHAASAEADAISATPPGYFYSKDETGLLEGLAEVCEAAPKTPFYYYHIPALSGVVIDPAKFTRMAIKRLPTFVGIKYSDGASLYRLPSLREAGPGLEFLSGSDEAYLETLALGYQSAVGSTYNFGAPIYQEVARAFAAGDLETARLWQHRALQMIDACISTCGRAGLKVMMEMIDLDCGPVRRPIDPATPEQVTALRTKLDEIGFPDWI